MKLLALLPYDERVRRKHALVFGFLVDWWHKDYGDALASSRFVAEKMEERRHQIPNGKGLSAPQVHNAMTDLADWGFLAKVRGKGRWANRYVPNWLLVCSAAQKEACATSCREAISATSCQDDCVSWLGSTNEPCVTTSGSEDPFTRPGHRPGDLLNGNHSHAAHSGNTASASAGGVPEGARGLEARFNEFWVVFPKKLKRQRALDAYEKLAPDADLHALIMSKAKELAAHHDEHGTEFKWIREPHNWLAQKGWLEDLPAVYDNPKAAKPEKKAGTKPATAAKPKPPASANSNAPSPTRQWQRFTIDGADIEMHAKGSVLVVTLMPENGDPTTERIVLEDAKQEKQDEGQSQFGMLRYAVGTDDIEDAKQLLGLTFERRTKGGKPEYRAIVAEAA